MDGEEQRHYDIFGIDYYLAKRSNIEYRNFLLSQDIPFLEHDCGSFPYPIEDKSFDILTCIGAITFYASTVEEVEERWPKVLDEFARIARKTFAISVNQGWKFRAGKTLLREWEHPEFELVYNNQHLFRWESK